MDRKFKLRIPLKEMKANFSATITTLPLSPKWNL